MKIMLKLITFTLVLSCPCIAQEGKKFELEVITKEMVKLHLSMSAIEVKNIIGPSFWENGDLVGENGSGINLWQIRPDESDRSIDGKISVKFLMVRIIKDKVIEIKTILTSGMIGVGR